MTGLLVNMIGGLFLVAALGILGLIVYRGVANAYRETVLDDVEGKGAQDHKHRRFGHFLWRLVYPVLAVIGIIFKVMFELMNTEPEKVGDTFYRNGSLWHRDSDGLWRDSNGKIDYSASRFGPPY